MDRFYFAGKNWAETPFLEGEEAHHCARVMRKRAGEEIEIFDGQGRAARVKILDVGKERVTLSLLEKPIENAPLSPEITLAVGIPKGKTMDLIIQKAVELGVASIQPLNCDQGMVKAVAGDKKREKWQRVALEACKQCGQNFLPEVREPMRASDFLSEKTDGNLALVAALRAEARPFSEVLRGNELKKVTLLIGPEGDFSATEYERAFTAGFVPIALGELVLRVETAALYAISVIRYEGGIERK